MTVIVLAAMLPAGSADSFALEESEITVPETIQAEPNPLVEEPLPRTELDGFRYCNFTFFLLLVIIFCNCYN